MSRAWDAWPNDCFHSTFMSEYMVSTILLLPMVARLDQPLTQRQTCTIFQLPVVTIFLTGCYCFTYGILWRCRSVSIRLPRFFCLYRTSERLVLNWSSQAILYDFVYPSPVGGKIQYNTSLPPCTCKRIVIVYHLGFV